MIFGERLEYLRNEKGLTQKELAKNLEMSSGMISSYERGVSLPDVEQLKRMCDFFNVSPEYFLCYTNSPLPINQKDRSKYHFLYEKELTPEMKKDVDVYIEFLIYTKNRKGK